VIERGLSDTAADLAVSTVPCVCLCDLDGTLLRSDATLSNFSRNGLNRLVRAGVGVTVASGRSLQAMRALLDGVDLQLPVIGLNGALISDMLSGEHLLVKALGSSHACAALGMLSDYGASPVITSWDGTSDRVSFPSVMNHASNWWIAEKRAYLDPRLRPTNDLDAVLSAEDVVLITGFVPNASAEQLVTQLEAELGGSAIIHAGEHIYCTGWTEFQIQHPHADKGRGLQRLLELTGLRRATVIACGDHLNDLGMFAAADEAVAPANAHAAVLAAATTTVAGNDDDGVIRWLLQRAGL
jgi:hypothetical protein